MDRILPNKRKQTWLLALFTWTTLSCVAQQENIWVVPPLDFNNGEPVVLDGGFQISELQEAVAMVCNDNGQLLFYTTGYRIWDKTQNLMPNGQELLTGFPINPIRSSRQGAVIIPMPANPDKYYVFYVTATTAGARLSDSAGRLYYSIIDMKLNSGLGDVEVNNKSIFLVDGLIEGISAVVGDRCNVWLLTKSRSDSLKAFEITENGINAVPVCSPVYDQVMRQSPYGSIKTSIDRKKVLISTSYNYYLLDFDPYTGKATNPISVLPSSNTSLGIDVYVPEFSPDGAKLYASDVRTLTQQWNTLYQYDISLGATSDIYNSRVAIAQNLSGDIKLGPDGKIYFSANGNFGRLKYPNLKGLACDYEAAFIQGSGIDALPNVIPVIKRDTILSKQTVIPLCFISSVILKADKDYGWEYTWSNGAHTPSLHTDTPGKYWVTYYTPPCNYHVDTIELSLINGVLPNINIQHSCKNEDNGKAWAYTYSSDTVTYHYTWINANLDTLSYTDTLNCSPSGEYTICISTSECDTLISIFIPEEDYTVSFTTDTLACEGEQIHLHNTSNPYFHSFTWFFDQKDTSSLKDAVYTFHKTGVYEIKLTGKGNHCSDTATAYITVDEPVKELKIDKDKNAICLGEALTFSCEADITNTGFLWLPGDGKEVKDTNTFRHTYDKAGIMPVLLYSQYRACSDIIVSDTIIIHPIPVVDLGSDTLLCMNKESIILKNHATNNAPEPFQHYWTPGNDTSLTLTVTHPGVYTLHIHNSFGCSNAESITIHKDCYINIPNVFTPNGDGYNDYFFPRELLSKNITRFKMQIFNRWGQLIFETQKTEGRLWDGKLTGIDQPEGVYLYLIEAEIKGGKAEHYQGNITLIR